MKNEKPARLMTDAEKIELYAEIKCNTCGETKSRDEFNNHHITRSGKLGSCRVCSNLKSRLYNKSKQTSLSENELMKMFPVVSCDKCGESKPRTDFNNSSYRITGKDSWCKVCRKNYRDAHQLECLWHRLMQRCHNPDHMLYYNWGALGISVYKPWQTDMQLFIQWMSENLGLKPSSKHSLDRLDNEGDYCPGNIEWADFQTQASNRRNSYTYILNSPTGVTYCTRSLKRFYDTNGLTQGAFSHILNTNLKNEAGWSASTIEHPSVTEIKLAELTDEVEFGTYLKRIFNPNLKAVKYNI